MHNAPASLRYLGHATVLIELAGRRILTDPVLTDRVAFIPVSYTHLTLPTILLV